MAAEPVITLEDEFNAQIEEMRELREETCGVGQPGRREALSRWFCENVLGIIDEDENEEAAAIGCPPVGAGAPGGGVGDKGVDFFHIENDGSQDESEKKIHWGQCKLGDNLDYTFNQDDLDKLAKTIDFLVRAGFIAGIISIIIAVCFFILLLQLIMKKK